MGNVRKTVAANRMSAGLRNAVCFTLVFALCFGLLASCSWFGLTSQKSQNLSLPNPQPQPVAGTPVGTPASTPDNYGDVYAALTRIFENGGGLYAQNYALYGFSSSPALAAEGLAVASGSSDVASKGYSETNVQVAGIDEGDVVKTDGEYIYIVSSSEVVILRAAGKNTVELARVDINADMLNKGLLANSYGYEYKVSPREIYVSGDTLIIIYGYSIQEPVHVYSDNQGSTDIITPDAPSVGISDRDYNYYVSYIYRSVTEVALYDVSDPQNPRYINSCGQDGSLTSSRLQNGVLYLVTNYWVYPSPLFAEDNPLTYVPAYYTGEKREAFAAADIRISPEYSSSSYAVISSLDIENKRWIDHKTMLGAVGTLYMSYDNLYLAAGTFDRAVMGSRKEDSLTITEYKEAYSTRIIKFSLDEGSIGYVAEAVIPGYLINQFALDEYNGYLRAVVTVNSNTYRVLDDGDSEMFDYRSYVSAPTTTALYVLDEELLICGNIEGLAEDERVYSVRFDGAVGYFVTFRQVDPLFSVDLSDPRNPRIQGELKIPGFSSYMHPYDTNRLFGLGMAADDNGRTQGLKISMFDTSDPYNITEKHNLALEGWYSEALNDHRAIIVNSEHNLIGFLVNGGCYLIYGYSDEAGFYLRQSLGQNEDDRYYYYRSFARGLFIDEYFYICTADLVSVYTLDTLELVTKLVMEVSESSVAYPYHPYLTITDFAAAIS